MPLPSPESLQAFVLAAELGSFSAAARRMKKAQSAVSTAIANLEVDTGLQLFDRRTRSPTLTPDGLSLLPLANGILLGNREFMAKAGSLAEGVEDSLTLVVEPGIHLDPVLSILDGLSEAFPTVSLEVLTAGPNDTAALLKEGRADIGLMTEQERYPSGFQFRGVGHWALVPVCGPMHPLAGHEGLTYSDLRQHRQIVLRSRYRETQRHVGEAKSASVWYAESPAVIADLALRGLGWAELPMPAVVRFLEAGSLVRMAYAFQQSDTFEGIDVVWTERRALGQAGQWVRDHLLAVPQEDWLGK